MSSLHQPEPHSEDQERLALLDALASIGDRSIRSETLKPQIEDLHQKLAAKLSSGSPQSFETVGLGLKRCGTALAFKAPIYATIAGLLTVADDSYAKDLAKQLAENVSKDLAAAIRDGKAGEARRALRFLTCLGCSSMIAPSSVADYISILLEAALFEMTDAKRAEHGVHCRGEFLANIALSVMPWAGVFLQEHASDELGKILNVIRQISETWIPGRWRCIAPATDTRCMESFSELMQSTFMLDDLNWVCSEDVIPRPYRVFEEQLSGGQRIQLPTLTIPSHSKITRYSAPRSRLFLVNAKPKVKVKSALKEEVKVKKEEMSTAEDEKRVKVKVEKPATGNTDVIDLDADDGHLGGAKASADTSDDVMKEVPNETDPVNGPSNSEPGDMVDDDLKPVARSIVEKYVLRSYIQDIVENFSANHVLAAEKLLNIQMLKSADDEIVEGLFSQLCAMPEPTFAPLYYGTLFVDLCRVKDSRLPIKLLTAVESIFQDAGHFDPEAFDRLTEWFSFHLSNFEYKWNWTDWALYADADMVDKFPFRALFCKDVLSRCIRLAYFERVTDIVPDEMSLFLPSKPTQGDVSRFDEAVNEELMRIVTGKSRQEARVVRETLSRLVPAQTTPSDPIQAKLAEEHANSMRLAALIRAILKAGCKTLSHFDTVAERYLALLQDMVQKGGIPAKRLVTLEACWFWKDVHIRRMYVLDKLSMNRVIDGLAIIDAILSEERPDGSESVPLTDEELQANLADSSCWEILRLVMQRARAREEGARAELIAASEAAAAATEGDTEKAENRLERAKAGTENAMREISELLLLSFRRLFDLSARLADEEFMTAEDEMPGDVDEAPRLPGFDGKPVWYWRCIGMVRELARKHPRHIPSIIKRLENDTKTIREKHKPLWDSFEVIREVEECALAPHVT